MEETHKMNLNTIIIYSDINGHCSHIDVFGNNNDNNSYISHNAADLILELMRKFVFKFYA